MGVRLRRWDRRGPGRPEGAARRQGRRAGGDEPHRHPGTARIHPHHRGLPRLPEGTASSIPTGCATRWPSTWRGSRGCRASASATPADPLLVSVRSGAPVSMPGMMDTVLNLGLNRDHRRRPHRRRRGRALPPRRLPPPAHHVRRRGDGRAAQGVRAHPQAGAAGAGRRHRRRALRRVARARRRALRSADRGDGGGAVPAGPAGAAVGRHRRRVRQLGQPAGARLPAPARPRRGHGDRGQRADHGVRQPRRRLRDGGGVHAQPGHRRARHLRRVPAQRPGRGRGGRHPHAAVDQPAGRPGRSGRALRRRLRAAPAGVPRPRGPLQGHAGRRVHHRGRRPLHAADAHRQAHRPGGGAHRRRPGRRGADRRGHRLDPRRRPAHRADDGAGVRRRREEARRSRTDACWPRGCRRDPARRRGASP